LSLLLDTHTLIWWLANAPTLADAARTAIADDPDVFVSTASAWEIAIKQSIGKLDVPTDLEAQLQHQGFEPLPITMAHALAAGSLPKHHADPFDRMLIAQATIEGLTVVTRDSRFSLYGVPTLGA
jgi:PIN domain nuclease of toxin-antitoxin system